MIRRPPRSTQSRSSAASDVYKRQVSFSNQPGDWWGVWWSWGVPGSGPRGDPFDLGHHVFPGWSWFYRLHHLLGGYPRDTFWRHTSFTDLYQSSYPGNYHRCCDHHRWRPSLAREYLPTVSYTHLRAHET